MAQNNQLLRRQVDILLDILNHFIVYRIFRELEDSNNQELKSIHDTYYDSMRILYDSVCVNAFCLIVKTNENAHYSKLADPSNSLITAQIGNELSLLGLSSTQTLEEDLKSIFEKRSGIIFNQITQELAELEFYRNKMAAHADDYDPVTEQRYYPCTENSAKLSFEILRFILQINPKLEVGFNLNQPFDEYINHKKIELKQKLIESLETLIQTRALSNLVNQDWQIVDKITGNEIERLKIRLKRITEDILRYYAKYKFINYHKFRFSNNLIKNAIFNSLVLKINILFGEAEKGNQETHYLRLVDKIPAVEIAVCANKILNTTNSAKTILDRLDEALLNRAGIISIDEVCEAKKIFKAPRNDIAHARQIKLSSVDERHLKTMVQFTFGLWAFLDTMDNSHQLQDSYGLNDLIQKFENEFERDLPILIELLHSS